MTDEVKTAPVVEAKITEPAKTEAVTEPEVKEVKAVKEATIGETLDTEKKEPKLVPEAVLLEYKRQNKELAKDVKELKALVESGAPKKEVSATIKALGEEYPDSKEFIEKFYTAVKAEVETETEDKFTSKLKPLEDEKRSVKIDKIFNENYDKTLESLPEYNGVANKEVIKSLVLDPKNANKTFSKIMEEAYGHLIQGRKTLEPTKPGGGRDDAEIDFAKAQTDGDYLKTLLADPQTKKKYNDELTKRLSKYL